jgi:PAS domain S-box-containing protein
LNRIVFFHHFRIDSFKMQEKAGRLSSSGMQDGMSRTVKVLLVDDNEADRVLILRALRGDLRRLEACEVTDSDSFSRALEATRYDLAIVERRTGWGCGLKIGAMLRQRFPACPLLMFSRDDSMEAAMEALRAGFDDYLAKSPGRLARLPRAAGELIDRGRAMKREAWVETRTQDLLARLNVGVYRATTRGIMLYANDAFCRIFGISSWREAPNWSLRAAMADPGEEARLAKELRRNGLLQAVEVRLRGPGGRDQWISLTQCLRSGGETLAVIEGLVEDITERKLMTIASKRREEEVRQHQRLETVGQLAGGVAHDFNNLLTAINGYSELIMGSLPEDHPLRDNVDEIRKAGTRAAILTRQLLAFSSRLLLQPRRFDLNALLKRMEGAIRETLGSSVHVLCFPAVGLGPVYADPSQLENCIMSLVHNAREAMPTGGSLHLRTGEVRISEDGKGDAWDIIPGDRMRPGPYALIMMEDSGTGMKKDVLARIFEPFFTTKPMGKGTGLGLSTVYGILKQSGGAIHADSEPGKGARFRLYLPLARPGQGLSPAGSREAPGESLS